MKTFVLLMRICCVTLCCILLVFSCRKPDKDGGSSNPGTSAANADSLSDHLQFFTATKKQGKAPAAPKGGSLKISFEDTLYLIDKVKVPIKFQHLDTTQNVAGVFLQVEAVTNSGPVDASYYYDVPEISQMDSSDTVSVIMIGIDPTNLKIPLSFNVNIIPYNNNHQPIAQAVRPVKITEHKTDPKTNGSCGLILPLGEYWDWDLTYSPGLINGTDFIDDPNTVFGASGQYINGSCCAGISIYGICPGERQPNRKLHFATYYQIMAETLTFHDDGTYFRQTIEDGTDPVPDASDFCGSGEGMVRHNLRQTIYNGTYSVTPATLPPDLAVYHDSLRLGLLTASTTPQGGGYGNGGGIIHQLDCTIGALVLIQVDLEGFGKHIYKFYSRHKIGQSKWYDFK